MTLPGSIDEGELLDFVLEAKKATYASGEPGRAGPRAGTKDHPYERGPWSYLDSYYGGLAFLGQEVVHKDGKPLWGMNYFGRTETRDEVPGFSAFLKAALSAAPREAPWRGPAVLAEGDLEYSCRWEGDCASFRGEEEILHRGARIYSLSFHGGLIE